MSIDYTQIAEEWLGVTTHATGEKPIRYASRDDLVIVLKRVASEAMAQQKERDEEIAREHARKNRYPEVAAGDYVEDLIHAGHDAAGEQIADAIRNQGEA